jgi:hypothetical protein
MGLDFVLAHQERLYLATEAEKLDYFLGTLGLNHSHLPQRTYRSRHGRTIATRYFVDKFPLFLSGASSAPSPVVWFCYVDGNIADRGGRSHDPVNGPRGALAHRLEEVGRTWEERNACVKHRRKNKISRAGATPVCVARWPPQARFVPIVTSGVAPALEEVLLAMRIP